MKPDFRRTMIWLHTYTGLLIGWLLFAIFLTGTLSYFNDEITQWMQPESGFYHPDEDMLYSSANSCVNTRTNARTNSLINISIEKLKEQGTAVDNWRIELPTLRNNQWRLQWQKEKERYSQVLSRENAEPISLRDTRGGDFFRTFHYSLELRAYGGRYFAGIAAVFMLLAVFTGIFTHRRFFRDFFTLRKNTVLKTLTDFHAIAGIVTIPFCFIICASALVIYIGLYMPWSAQYYLEGGSRELNKKVSTGLPQLSRANVYKEPITDFCVITKQVEKIWPDNPKITSITFEQPYDENGRIIIARSKEQSLSNKYDKLAFSSHSAQQLNGVPAERLARNIRRIFYGLHEAHFARLGLRWLCFIMGMLSCGLIASGLIIWLKKRLDKVKQRHLGHFIVERLNIAGIAGLNLSIVGYFYANRLVPLSTVERADVEVRVFLLIWLVSLLHALFRPANKAWVEQLLIASVACLFLPIIDYLQQPLWLTRAIKEGDFVYIGFELALLVSAWVLYRVAKRLTRKMNEPHRHRQGMTKTANTNISIKNINIKKGIKKATDNNHVC